MKAPPQSAARTILIRPMAPSDLEQVLEIDRLSFSMPWPTSAYEYELYENPNSLLWVADASQPDGTHRVIGMIVVWLILDEAHIATIAVHPDLRGRGIAKGLLATALKEIIRRGIQRATLEVRANNLAAQRLYRSFGFEFVGIRPRYYQDNREDALIMTAHNLDQTYQEGLEKYLLKFHLGESHDA